MNPDAVTTAPAPTASATSPTTSAALNTASPSAAPGSTATPVITAAGLQNSPTPISVPTPPTPTAAASLQGAVQGTQTDWQQQLANNAQNAQGAMGGSLQDLLHAELTGGPAQFTNTTYGADGVDQAHLDLVNTNNAITAEQNALNQKVAALRQNDQGLFGTGTQQEIDQANTQSLARQANLAVIQLSKQGAYDSAKAIADRAVAAQTEARQNQINTLQQIYTANKDIFTTAEQQQFEAAQTQRSSELATQQHDLTAQFDAKIATQKSAQDYYNQYGAWPASYNPASGTYSATNTSSGAGGDQSTIVNGYQLGASPTLGAYASNTATQVANVNATVAKIQSAVGTIANAQQAQAALAAVAPGSPITGDMVMAAATKYGVDPSVIIGVMQAETQCGTDGSKGAQDCNYGNVGNTDAAMAAGKPVSMTPQQGVDAVAQNLASRKTTDSGSSTTTPSGVPTTDSEAMNSTNPNDQLAFALASGASAPSQILTARNLSGNSPAARVIFNRANAISEKLYGQPFSQADAEAAFKVRNSQPYQTYITSAPNAVRAIGEVMTNLKILNNAGYLAGVSSLNSIKLKLLANGVAFYAPQNVKDAAANVLSALSQSQDDIGKLLGTGQGSDAKLALAGEIFNQQGGLNTTSAVADNVSTNITQKLGDMFSAAGVKTDSPAFKAEMARLQPSLDAIAKAGSSAGFTTMTGPRGTFQVPNDKVQIFKQNGYQ